MIGMTVPATMMTASDFLGQSRISSMWQWLIKKLGHRYSGGGVFCLGLCIKLKTMSASAIVHFIASVGFGSMAVGITLIFLSGFVFTELWHKIGEAFTS